MSKAKNWCFTLNNYSPDDVVHLSTMFGQGGVKYLIFGREVGQSGTPHLQGFVCFSRRKSLAVVRNAISNQAHCEVARCIPASIEYCKKDGDYEEYGELDATAPGKRNEFDAFKDAVKGGMYDMKELREQHSNVCARYPRFVMDYVKDHEPLKVIEDHEYRSWQTQVDEIGIHDLL